MKITYKFNDSKGNIYWFCFGSVEEAMRFGYVHGLCFLGRG